MQKLPALALHALWALLLLLPNVTLAAYANAWSVPRWQPAAVSLWIVTALWLLPQRLMLALTAPLVLAGLAVVTADFARGADALDLLSVAYTFRRDEVVATLGPYLWPAAIAAAAVAALAALLWRQPRATRMSTRARVIVTFAGLGLLVGVPADGWRAAWPPALAGAIVEGRVGDTGIGVANTPDSRTSPRDRFSTWGAHRASAPANRETYVLVIGESVRSDRVPGCGGRPDLMQAAAGSLVYCDVLAGGGGTHVSVPLLVSRALPGNRDRVPRDGTVLKAFEAVGFETFWLAAQDRTIAWPDARNQAFALGEALDRTALLPLLDQALARPEPRKAIVIHTYGAHLPYARRYDAAHAPFVVDRLRAGAGGPRRESMDQWWNDYDNAVDESMRFLREVVARVEAQHGEAVVLFTPDHGENMLDDDRGLTAHALRRPTFWDTRVPLIAWASSGWRAAHPLRWEMLAANLDAQLMHMDVAPTLLGAAGIQYEEPRREPIDLTDRLAAAARTRFTQLRAGAVVDMATLRQEAGRGAPD